MEQEASRVERTHSIIEQIVLKVLDGMVGIGGIPGNEEFCDEFNMRLRAAMDVTLNEKL